MFCSPVHPLHLSPPGGARTSRGHVSIDKGHLCTGAAGVIMAEWWWDGGRGGVICRLAGRAVWDGRGVTWSGVVAVVTGDVWGDKRVVLSAAD